MLAAAPGVKAPLIAVLLRGDRAPAATDCVLRWPVAADELLSRAEFGFRGRARSRMRTRFPPPAAIDAVAFSTLEKSVGVKT